MTWGRVYWPAALITVLAVILVPESVALATGYRNTLSFFLHWWA